MCHNFRALAQCPRDKLATLYHKHSTTLISNFAEYTGCSQSDMASKVKLYQLVVSCLLWAYYSNHSSVQCVQINHNTHTTEAGNQSRQYRNDYHT